MLRFLLFLLLLGSYFQFILAFVKFSRIRGSLLSTPLFIGNKNTFHDNFDEAVTKADNMGVPEKKRLEFIKIALSEVVRAENDAFKILMTEAESKVVKAEAEAESKVVKAEAEAESKVVKAEAEIKVVKAEAEIKVVKAEAEAESKVVKAQSQANEYKLRLETTQKDLLQSKGLMTSRGIYENLLQAVGKELKSPTARKNPTCTEVCEIVAGMVESNTVPPDNLLSLAVLYKIYSDCNINTPEKGRRSYNEVSVEIHGFPWNGEAVKVYTSKMSKDSQLKCIITAVARHYNFDIFDVEPMDMDK